MGFDSCASCRAGGACEGGYLLSPPILHTGYAPWVLGDELAATAQTQNDFTINWVQAAYAQLVPFHLDQSTTYGTAWYCPTAVGHNFDLGVYDESLNRLSHTGTIASAGGNYQQAALGGTTTLAPGSYYMALSLSADSVIGLYLASGQPTGFLTTWGVRSVGFGHGAIGAALPDPFPALSYCQQSHLALFGLRI